jgi:hypothetical protein
MSSTISYDISDAPLTSGLFAPSEVQRTDDFDSTGTSASTESDLSTLSENIDWSRLHGYIATPRLSKRPKSHIWIYGTRVKKLSSNHDYWLCRICHLKQPLPQYPSGHIYRCSSTSQAIDHLKDKHSIDENGQIRVKPQRSTQRTIDTYGSLLAARNEAITAFNLAYFKALLVRLFTTEQLAFMKVESEAFRDLLIYLQPLLRGSIPSSRSLVRYVGFAYRASLSEVEQSLAKARSRINLSFDLWSSPGRRLSLLGVVAHYLDANWKPATVLLALPRMFGSHTGVNIATQIHGILRHFRIGDNFGYAIADNASENTACLDHLSELLHIDLDSRRVMCMGHVINLVAQECLFGSDVEAFEEELTNVTAEELELRQWRKRGPIGKLHNLIRYINHSTKRRDLLRSIQGAQYYCRQDSANPPTEPLKYYDLIRDNHTRWNSWYDAAVRALKLRTAIDEFIDHELGEYHAAVARFASSRSQAKRSPKKPSLLSDVLDVDDWSIVTQYVALLQPCKQATMLLQGHINTTARDEKAVKGAIWQVLPVFESLMSAFEDARQRHLPIETLESQRSQLAAVQSSPPSSPPPIPSPVLVRITRSSQSLPIPHISAPTDTSAANITATTADERTREAVEAGALGINERLESQKHFSTNINLAWQKLDAYYRKTDLTAIYRAAVVLHPRLKWRWFDKYWNDKPQWRKNAKEAVKTLWSEYSHMAVQSDDYSNQSNSPTIIRDEWSSPEEQTSAFDQFEAYIAEPFAQVPQDQSPIPYWYGKRSVWPQLAQMALDIYSTPACSDEPERIFSQAGNVLTPRRRQLTGDHVEQVLCLRSWQASGIVTLDGALFEQAVRGADSMPISDDDDDEVTNNTRNSDNKVLYHEHEQ